MAKIGTLTFVSRITRTLLIFWCCKEREILKKEKLQVLTMPKSFQPFENSWKSGGPLMVFQQPQSGVLTKEEAKEAPFQDFTDR